MPTYSYRCIDCEHAFDIRQSITEDSLTICPECEGTLRKQFSAVGISFKGSGFYATDSRSSGGSQGNKSTASEASSSISATSSTSSEPSASAAAGAASAASTPAASSTAASATN